MCDFARAQFGAMCTNSYSVGILAADTHATIGWALVEKWGRGNEVERIAQFRSHGAKSLTYSHRQR